MIAEHDRVILTADIEPDGLMVGDVGTVVHIYRDRRAYEVEFVSLDGTTAAVVAVAADRVRPVRHNEIAHARALAVA
jgi:hypothetical protein